MELQIEFAEMHELVQHLNIVVSCITSLPFGMTQTRARLQHILEAKIERNHFLRMHFHFFLLSYLQCVDVQRLFRRHRVMKKVKASGDFYRYQHLRDDIEPSELGSETPNMSISTAPYTPRGPIADAVDANLNLNLSVAGESTAERVVWFKEKDPIKLFRAALDHSAKVGFTVMVAPELQHCFFDPINGNHGVQKLVVRSVFSSNARPFLIDW